MVAYPFRIISLIDSAYVKYEKDGQKLWECDDKIPDINNFFATYDEAVVACNKNSACKFIENEDCSGTEGYELCTSVTTDGKSCALEKTGS